VLQESRKGIDVLLRALAAVRARMPDARLLIVGDGPLHGPLARMAASLGIDDIIRFAGVRRDIPGILAGSDAFVFPTRRDPLPTVLIEAMMAGLPVISSDVDGVPEIVERDCTGILVPPADVDALGGALVALAGDPPLRAAFGERGRRRAHARFSATAWVDRLQRLYVDVLPPNVPHDVVIGQESRAS
jgi:glycosyltransferase involved in cell wall biosynthesis